MKRILFAFFTVLFLVSTNVTAQNTTKVSAKNLFGNLRARHIGPALMSGRFIDLAVHPTNSRIVYAGAAGGGVWKSNDAGTTFNPIFD